MYIFPKHKMCMVPLKPKCIGRFILSGRTHGAAWHSGSG